MTYGGPPPEPPPHWHDPWLHPHAGGYAPPVWPPTYWVPGPPPPPRSRWRAVAALAAIFVVLGSVGAGAGILVDRAINGHGLAATDASSIDSAIVDVVTDLGGGNSAAGTGMVISSSGDILTNNHVVESSFSVSVQMVSTGQTYQATVVGVDPTDDVAVIHINASGLTTIPFGDSSKVSVGDSVTAVGNALGKGGAPTVATGRITALNQTVTATDEGGANPETLTNMIESDAQIQPGDSGGPLIDSHGSVVGMNTAGSGRVHRTDLATNIGFAIPINTARSIAHQITSGTGGPNITNARNALLGVIARDSSNPPGALVVGTQPGTPAAGAGVHANDVIVAISGTPVDSVNSLHAALQQHKPGDSVSVSWVDASGASHSAQVTLAEGGVP